MRPRPWLLPLLAALGATVSCALPGATPPTSFVLPTQNLTLTPVFAPTQTPVVAIGTLAPGPAPTEHPIVVTPGVLPPTATLSTLSTRPNGPVIIAAWFGAAPTIDGELGEWSSSFFAADKIVDGASQWTGVDDNSGKFALGWDATYLYMAVEVTDDKYVQVASGDDIWMGDEIEFQLDGELAADFYTTSLSADDTQLGLSLGNFGSIPAQSYRWYPQSQRGAVPNVTVAGKATPQGYDVEARIPWAAFGVTAAEGGRYGFALSISDDDLPGVAAQQSMVSSVSTRTLFNPTTWGTLALAGPPK